jgi:hypothetical protein
VGFSCNINWLSYALEPLEKQPAASERGAKQPTP